MQGNPKCRRIPEKTNRSRKCLTIHATICWPGSSLQLRACAPQVYLRPVRLKLPLHAPKSTIDQRPSGRTNKHKSTSAIYCTRHVTNDLHAQPAISNMRK
jgi:hypothetical protein